LAEPLHGTAIVRELDGLLAQLHREVRTDGNDSTRTTRVATTKSSIPVDVVRAIDHAIDRGSKVDLLYRGAKDPQATTREVDPVQWRLCGTQLYLIAFDARREAWRTFKSSRIEAVQIRMDKITPREFDEQALFGKSVHIWSGPTVDVAVRLAHTVSRFAEEWPLCAEQRVEKEESGAAVVRAKVAGTAEAARWVLSWGGEAEALEPLELRERVQAELRTAMARYAADAKRAEGGVKTTGQGARGAENRRAGRAGKDGQRNQ
jgi:predicted DNA-binding transcriptional regulator YafY